MSRALSFVAGMLSIIMVLVAVFTFSHEVYFTKGDSCEGKAPCVVLQVNGSWIEIHY